MPERLRAPAIAGSGLMDAIGAVVALAVWLVLVTWVLPRLGVPT